MQKCVRCPSYRGSSLFTVGSFGRAEENRVSTGRLWWSDRFYPLLYVISHRSNCVTYYKWVYMLLLPLQKCLQSEFLWAHCILQKLEEQFVAKQVTIRWVYTDLKDAKINSSSTCRSKTRGQNQKNICLRRNYVSKHSTITAILLSCFNLMNC